MTSTKEDILIVGLELEQVIQSRLDFDVVGHYSRPDVFKLAVQE